MTYREKIIMTDPDAIDQYCDGGVKGCPGTYFKNAPLWSGNHCTEFGDECEICWNQEMPETEEKETKKPSETVLEWLDRVAERKDKSISIYISPDGSISVDVYPEKQEFEEPTFPDDMSKDQARDAINSLIRMDHRVKSAIDNLTNRYFKEEMR
jgi:hypothetical protein